MKVLEEIQDYVEYLVHHNYVKGLSDLTRQEFMKLSFLVLRDNNMYVKMIRIMHNLIKKEAIENN